MKGLIDHFVVFTS